MDGTAPSKKRNEPRIYVKGLILVAVPLVLEVILGVTLLYLQNIYREALEKEAHAKEVIYHANEMWLWTTDAVTSKFEGNISGDWQNYGDEQANIEKEYVYLKGLLQGDQKELNKLERMKQCVDNLISIGDQFEKSKEEVPEDMGAKIALIRGRVSTFVSLQHGFHYLRMAIIDLREPIFLQAKALTTQVAHLQDVMQKVTISGIIGSIILAMGLFTYFMSRINSAVQVLTGNTQRLAVNQPLLPLLNTTDEFGLLDESFHQMADALAAAVRRERATINHAGNMICSLDVDRKILSINPAGRKMLQAGEGELIGADVSELAVRGENDSLKEAVEKAHTSGEQSSFDCKLAVRRSNDIRWTLWTVNWSEDDQEFFCVIADVTERKQLSDELARVNEELQRSNTELQQFAYVASHDLQEPLRAISGYLDAFMRRHSSKLEKDGETLLGKAGDGAKRMQMLITDLLAYARVDARGKEFTITDTNNIVEIAMGNLKVALEEANAEVTYDGLPTILADGSQLVQLFQNLTGNAIKFKREGETPRVQISAVQDGDDWLFSVKDNGIGIDMQFADRIFTIFKRLHTRTNYAGTGIGLAICKKIVERHGGRIWIESEVGVGTTFLFTLPAVLSKPAVEEEAATV